MELKTKYITPDDFKEYWGIDLSIELPKNTITPTQFIKQREDYIARYLDSEYFQIVDDVYPTFTDYQKEHYKLALLNQCYYVFRNGDLTNNSGYDYEKGNIGKANPISDEAYKELVLCGLITRNLARGCGIL